MSESWGHTLERMTPAAIDLYARSRWVCRGRLCPRPVEYVTTYCYFTGRRGRVGVACRHVCAVHAEAFRVKHGLPVVA